MIPVRNIYYMLSYAFQVLNEQGYREIAAEPFDNTKELCAAILIKGISTQVKRGLGREYIRRTEPMSVPRGRLEFAESIKAQTMLQRQMVCTCDDFSVDFDMNRIIRSVLELLLGSDISKGRKKELRKLLLFFREVEPVDLHTVDWHMHYNRNNQTYRMLISVCCLVAKGLLQSNMDGGLPLMEFIDGQKMWRLYEKFILEYYRKEFPQIKVSASQISWKLDDDMDDMLPVMQSDVMLSFENKTLIIDAKYYSQTTQKNFGVHTQYSDNLYQMFAYVKNQSCKNTDTGEEVSGLILYAKTDEAVLPDNSYRMSGNRISVKTLDLNCDFADIASQLNQIVENTFGAVFLHSGFGIKKLR